MPRKAYIADVEAASGQAVAQSTPGITSVGKGSEDGELHICFVPPNGLPIEIMLIALDVGGYPSENVFMITTVSLDLPAGVNDVLQDVQESSAGALIPDLISTISRKLQRHFARQSETFDVDMEDPETDQEMDDDTDNFSDTDDEWQDPSTSKGQISMKASVNPEEAAKMNKRIRADLRAVKAAGFKVGILSGMHADSISSVISISVKIDQLGLSEEATEAWDLEQHQYVVLLVRYSNRYKDYEAIIEEPADYAQVEFKVGVCNKYKPTLVEALAAFGNMSTAVGYSFETPPEPNSQKEQPATEFSSIFISGSLNRFMGQLISLMKVRHNNGLNWADANKWINDNQSRINKDPNEADPPPYVDDQAPLMNSPPESLLKDHLTDGKGGDVSFPLLAAQFFFKYLVQCTEHCLVCHERTQEEFQALKPYVCDKPLCLYQYMALGFGPSIEHEILTQPYVVDLLISFCYASAFHQKIRIYPTGMSLLVPPVNCHPTQNLGFVGQPTNAPTTVTPIQFPDLLDVKFDAAQQEILFEGGAGCPVRNGEWVSIRPVSSTVFPSFSGHYRVMDSSMYPTVKLSKAIIIQRGNLVNNSNATNAPASPPGAGFVPAKMGIYNRNFDDMDIPSKAQSITTLLETLPSIKEMRDYLMRQKRVSEPNLRLWKERVSPAALGLLRWIIASNRSCIVQVDACPGQDENDAALAKIRPDQKILHLPGNWVQFRFAQGSPDKEERFLNALREQQGNLNSNYPTLFAWHGSSTFNWHSIIRSGLDFKDTQHGRAYGHGVYHAMDQQTSYSYAAEYAQIWPGSELRLSRAMSLNEIINCPAQFTSSSPFLVVQHIDWIQCRYLLVQVQDNLNLTYNAQPANTNTAVEISDPDPLVEIIQDPNFTAMSTRGKPIGVPLCAVTTSKLFRAGGSGETAPPQKKLKRSGGSASTAIESGSEEEEELLFLLSDDEELGAGKVKGKSHEEAAAFPPMEGLISSLTDFIPGSLDQSTLPMLEPPSYATPMATKTLNRNLKEILEIQKKTKIHELGWYINPELISNVYQWIVELHSFDPTIPLAEDMKDAGVTSVVLEMRFGKDYPHTPPFVRVIRPRFLPFTAGGGGHVTGGGAMCMELLTNSGWSAVSSIESVLLQVRMAMMNLEPRPARLQSNSQSQQRDYGIGEAIDAYRRACIAHGWQIPPDFGEFISNEAVGATI